MSNTEYDKVTSLGAESNTKLVEAYKTGDIKGDLAQEVARLHKEWITKWWGHYNKEAHCGLVKMYVEDKRFTAYYDKEQPGLAEFLRDSVLHFNSK